MLQAKRLAGDAANTDPTWKFLSYWDPEGSEKVCREAHDWTVDQLSDDGHPPAGQPVEVKAKAKGKSKAAPKGKSKAASKAKAEKKEAERKDEPGTKAKEKAQAATKETAKGKAKAKALRDSGEGKNCSQLMDLISR